ncbi:hypothetical protein [Yersinia intermedia]|uniref:hypothetical protein n=1 Tax=Yersinia intermedia TaxID=631 RepID=UPI00065D1850|nr:hypothetical protein [Yersinia intermedia]CRY84137.1 Uncharacterised protein [Yersinia intermedia]
MFYTLLIVIIMLSAVMLAAKQMSASLSSKVERARIVLVPVILISPLMVAAPIMGPILGVGFSNPADAEDLPISFNTQLFVIISLIGCVILTVISLWGYYKKCKVAAMFCAVSSIISAGSAADYLHFTYNREMAGTVNFEFFRDVVSDMECSSGILNIQWDQKETTPVTYRCATSSTYGFMGPQPLFIPWPDYHSGKSKMLSQALSATLKSAHKKHTAN